MKSLLPAPSGRRNFAFRSFLQRRRCDILASVGDKESIHDKRIGKLFKLWKLPAGFGGSLLGLLCGAGLLLWLLCGAGLLLGTGDARRRRSDRGKRIRAHAI